MFKVLLCLFNKMQWIQLDLDNAIKIRTILNRHSYTHITNVEHNEL